MILLVHDRSAWWWSRLLRLSSVSRRGSLRHSHANRNVDHSNLGLRRRHWEGQRNIAIVDLPLILDAGVRAVEAVHRKELMDLSEVSVHFNDVMIGHFVRVRLNARQRNHGRNVLHIGSCNPASDVGLVHLRNVSQRDDDLSLFGRIS